MSIMSEDSGHITTDCQLFLENEFAEQAIGRVLIIGANQGNNNPAYHLIRSGWKAVCCEPDPYACSILIELFSKYADNITIVNSAISVAGGLAPFFLSIGRPAMSSMHEDWLAKQNVIPDEEKKQQRILTHTLSVQQLLEHVGTDFDLVVIDAEGSDEDIINAIDWSQLSNCSVLCCEGSDGAELTLKEAGFSLYHQNVNHYFKRRINTYHEYNSRTN